MATYYGIKCAGASRPLKGKYRTKITAKIGLALYKRKHPKRRGCHLVKGTAGSLIAPQALAGYRKRKRRR